MIKPLVFWPNQKLRQRSEPVPFADILSPEIQTLITDLIDTCNTYDGVGISAIQLGVPKRIVIVGSQVLINPDIESLDSEKTEHVEGCLSFPGVMANVLRADDVIVNYFNGQGERYRTQFTGLEAQCVQHELDHLEGVVFTDHLSSLKRNMLLKKVGKFSKKHEEVLSKVGSK